MLGSKECRLVIIAKLARPFASLFLVIPKNVDDRKVVPRRRFERPTCRLGGGCSIQLSYRSMALSLRSGAIVKSFAT